MLSRQKNFQPILTEVELYIDRHVFIPNPKECFLL